MVQDCCSGRGKSELNNVSKSKSKVHTHVGLLPNEQDGMSKMALHFPSICIGVSGQEWFSFSLRVSAWMRFSTTIDFFEASCSIQLTVGMLLPNNVICFLHKFPRRPTISRSEFGILPHGLVGGTMFNLNFFCHSH